MQVYECESCHTLVVDRKAHRRSCVRNAKKRPPFSGFRFIGRLNTEDTTMTGRV